MVGTSKISDTNLKALIVLCHGKMNLEGKKVGPYNRLAIMHQLHN